MKSKIIDSDEAAVEMREIEAIKQLKARYFRLLDTKKWQDLAMVFAPDVEVDVSEDAGPEAGHVRGRERFVAFLQSMVGEARTVHHGHMPEIERTGPDSARGTWAMYDYVEFPSEGARRGLHGFGHYHESYRKIDGAWRIQSMKLTRLRVDPLS